MGFRVGLEIDGWDGVGLEDLRMVEMGCWSVEEGDNRGTEEMGVGLRGLPAKVC